MCAEKINHEVKLNILAVEDEKDVQALYTAILTEEGHRVVTVSTGAQAIEKIAKEQFDLIILDLKLPDIDGTEVLKQIRKKTVIIVTAYPSLETTLDAIKTGVYDYIIKPFSPNQLRLVVYRVTEKIRLINENERLLRELKKTNKELKEKIKELKERN